MSLEMLGVGFIGLIISTIVAYFSGNRAATKKAEERARVARVEQEIIRTQEAAAEAKARAEALEQRRRIEREIDTLPPVSTGESRAAGDILRDEWSRD